ncbi:DUF4136 domain-containing protein [Wenzhouxiangella sp. XN79A]|uniref:DUF4136 domain-containing protein n=1 Tax=Wenzhouxiangella sp. XN79A TaxID=2724193 RepID=UPI00144A8BD2|nr:DUF4136 domain-containing protein [Wenzhouxiangella sp. XN79A]NKI34424.1 DUF4136 domain-containing protein [Wenzhouxiangella sp. XN79A]
MTLDRASTLFLALMLATLLAGCATGPRVHTYSAPNVDFADYRTFGFIEETGTDRGGLAPKITEFFKSASRRELTALGYRYDPESPDLLINFFVNAEQHEDIYLHANLQSMDDYYDYRYGMYSTWPVYTLKAESNNYETGTITIDVVDARLEQLIWEGRVEGRLTQRVVSNPRGIISDSVTEIFSKLPAARR